MANGYKVIAIIKDESAVEIIDSNYKIIKTKNGTVCLTENIAKKFQPLESEEAN